MSLNEADTCRKYVLPKLQEWDTEPHFLTEQYYIDAGRILTTGKVRHRQRKFADYLLCYSRDFPLAVVEAKRKYKHAQDRNPVLSSFPGQNLYLTFLREAIFMTY